MVVNSFIDKCNIIQYGSSINVGKNPIAELYYGEKFSRLICHFNEDKLINLFNEKNISDLSKVKHVLHFKNCGSIDERNKSKKRTSSFDLVFFEIPSYWDGGIGYDYRTYNNQVGDFFIDTNGSNWFNSTNSTKWEEEGIFKEIPQDKILGKQHFDTGNEDISIDITSYVNDILMGTKKNYGIGICFDKIYEDNSNIGKQYVGFFTQNTHSFYKPYLQTTYSATIDDNRYNFYVDKENRLYLYAYIDGCLRNLDSMPVCSIDDNIYTVKQISKGVYEAIITPSNNIQPNNFYEDIWSNISYNGSSFSNITMEFATKNYSIASTITDRYIDQPRIIPTISGINYNERIVSGDIRKLIVECREEYKPNQSVDINSVYYRVYVKDGETEVTIIDYDKLNKSFTTHYTYIDTTSFVPAQYFIDIQINTNGEVINHKNKLMFEIIDKNNI